MHILKLIRNSLSYRRFSSLSATFQIWRFSLVAPASVAEFIMPQEESMFSSVE